MKKDHKIPQLQWQAFIWAVVAVLSTVGMYAQIP